MFFKGVCAPGGPMSPRGPSRVALAPPGPIRLSTQGPPDPLDQTSSSQLEKGVKERRGGRQERRDTRKRKWRRRMMTREVHGVCTQPWRGATGVQMGAALGCQPETSIGAEVQETGRHNCGSLPARAAPGCQYRSVFLSIRASTP